MVNPAPIPQLAEDALGKRAVASSILARCSRLILYCLNVREQYSSPTGVRVMVATRLVTETTQQKPIVICRREG